MGEFLKLVFHLDGEFPGGNENECPRAPTPARFTDLLEDRQDERGRLARARAGLSEHVAPFEGPGNEPSLHRCRHGVAGPINGGERRRGEAQGTEINLGHVGCAAGRGRLPVAAFEGGLAGFGGSARLRRAAAPVFHEHSWSSCRVRFRFRVSRRASYRPPSLRNISGGPAGTTP